MVDNLVFKHMVSLVVLDRKSKVMLRLVHHVGFIVSYSFGKVLNNTVVVLEVLRNHKLISEVFIFPFVLLYLLLQISILLF